MHRTLAFAVLSWLPLAALCADPAAIERCRTLTDPGERLACFDRAAAVPGDPAPAAKPAEPRAEDFGKPAPRPAELPKLTAGLRQLDRAARGRAVFVLDNGQTWRQVDGDTTVVHDPAPGQAVQVTIERGIFDTYDLRLSDRNGMVKVRRVR